MKAKSLRKKIQTSYIFIIFVMLIPAGYSLIFSHVHRKQYDSIISNVSLANQITNINYTYTFGDDVVESGSGVSYVAFYLERVASNKVFNP
ncbi:MAG: hypothetical protein II110_10430, partial [Treponema sp.]|nr:hypothetical protein [Treponema sp.]